jgi:hypothetical protein
MKVMDMSEIKNGECPECGKRTLEPCEKEYTNNEDHELIYTILQCHTCKTIIKAYND